MSTNGEVNNKGQLITAHDILQFWKFIILVDVIALLLGVSFFLIIHGVVMGMFRLSYRWPLANKIWRRIYGSNLFIEQKSTGNIRRVFIFFQTTIWIIVAVVFIGFGFWLLIDKGFYEQNIIWSIFN